MPFFAVVSISTGNLGLERIELGPESGDFGFEASALVPLRRSPHAPRTYLPTVRLPLDDPAAVASPEALKLRR